MHLADLQASLFSLPLSVLPDWLEFLEPFSALLSCGGLSGRSNRAFRRQIAANSILATGMADDWPSLRGHNRKAISTTHFTGVTAECIEWHGMEV